MPREHMKTTILSIAKYWSKHSDIPETDLKFDWDVEYCSKHCWNCGIKISKPQRAHIIPHSLGGVDKPYNYVLLCGDCHKDAPDVIDKDAMWDWIKNNNKNSFFALENLYKPELALTEFKKRRGVSFINTIQHIADNSNVENSVSFLREIGYVIHQRENNSWFIETNTKDDWEDLKILKNIIELIIVIDKTYTEEMIKTLAALVGVQKSLMKNFYNGASGRNGSTSVSTIYYSVNKTFDECLGKDIKEISLNKMYK
jgi:hypothetical protein